MNEAPRAVPYKCTSVFDENTLPAGLRREHRTKPGVWGIIRVLEGRLRYQVLDPVSEVILEPGRPGLVSPTALSRSDPHGCRSSFTISCQICSDSWPRDGLRNSQIGIR
jgi:tellurite resistance-related uncharacterized protein